MGGSRVTNCCVGYVEIQLFIFIRGIIMKLLTKAATFAVVLGMSSVANAGLIDLTGDINIEGFHHSIGDNDMTTFGLHITNLDGSLVLDPGGIGAFTGGSATLGGLPIPAPSTGGLFLSLLNAGLNSVLPSGGTFNFGGVNTGFGPATTLPAVTNVPLIFSTPPLPGFPSIPINTIFDSIQLSVSGNTLDLIFDEAGTGQFGSVSGLLFLVDSSSNGFSGTPNNGSLTSNFDIDVTTAPVPVPAAIWLMGSGLVGLFGFSRKKS